jgi:HSP20 family molecular chaperone IbpA
MADIDQPGNLLGDQPQSDSGNQSQAVQRREGDESGGQLGFPNSRFPFLNSMALDVKENDKSYDLKADLPGVPKENVNVEVDGDTLTISANRKEEKEDKGDKWHRMVSERGASIAITLGTFYINFLKNGLPCRNAAPAL